MLINGNNDHLIRPCISANRDTSLIRIPTCISDDQFERLSNHIREQVTSIRHRLGTLSQDLWGIARTAQLL